MILTNKEMIEYGFSPEDAFTKIKLSWEAWAKNANATRFVIGISGGIDSSTVAALACKIFGKENVIGVSLPCDGQSDMVDVDLLFSHLGIKRIDIDIGDAFNSIMNKIENNAIDMTSQCRTNMPARIRMTTLFGVAQCVNAFVLNTCNRSEDVCGWNTIFGDDCGSYAPLKMITKSEVVSLAKWLGLPDSLANKAPMDGLQPKTDEENFGFTYAECDRVIRNMKPYDMHAYALVQERYINGKFKLSIVNLPCPNMGYPDAFAHHE